MSNWLFALQLIPLITSLIRIAETLIGAGKGVQKKQYVKDGVKQTVKAMVTVSSGGQKATWQQVDAYMEPISDLIDVIVGLLFPHE